MDADRDLVAMLATALTRSGYDVDVARNNDDATTLLQTRDYDALIVNKSLPLASTLRAGGKHGERPAPAALILGVPADAATSGPAGHNVRIDYLTKPFSLRDLRSRLTRLLSKEPPRLQ